MAFNIDQQRCPNDHSNYQLGTNVINAFAVGAVGLPDDFFLVGSEPSPETDYPMLTGNVLDSEGNLLFRLVRNLLVVNPRNCSKIVGNHIGYEIHDGTGHQILKLETHYDDRTARYITTLEGQFFNKKREMVFEIRSDGAMSGADDLPVAFGVSSTGGFHVALNMPPERQMLVAAAMMSGGRINELLTGRHEGEDVYLDGKLIYKAELHNCVVYVISGDFLMTGSTVDGCTFRFGGGAERIMELVEAVFNSDAEAAKKPNA